MKIRLNIAALILISGATVYAGEGSPHTYLDEPVLLAAADVGGGTACMTPVSPAVADGACELAGWLQFPHGDLWSGYCAEKHRHADNLYRTTPSRPTRNLGTRPVRKEHHKSCARCRARRASMLNLLRDLFGWKRRTAYHVTYHDDAEQPRNAPIEPVVPSEPTEDALPLPPVPDPHTDDVLSPDWPMEPELPPDLPPIEPAPAPRPEPETPVEPDDIEPTPIPPSDLELPPTPADDPPPPPEPEVPRNQLPKAKPPATDAGRSTKASTKVAGRLSDYIRTR